MALSCFDSLARALALNASADVEVVLSLLRALESSGCVALFRERVSPVFQHCAWIEVIPQLLARLGDAQVGQVIQSLLESLVSASVRNAQAVFWPTKTARDGASWKQEQRDAAAILCRRIEEMHPEVRRALCCCFCFQEFFFFFFK